MITRYGRFGIQSWVRQQSGKIFARLVDEISTLLPDFGQVLALDSKAINSPARGKKRDKKPLKPDGRRDTGAD
jgi:hypothetical protein